MGDDAVIIVFLGVLPLVNGVFDFLSIGATRYLLRRGAEKAGPKTLLLAAADVVVGAAIFVALACASVIAVDLLRTRDGATLVSLDELFRDIDDNPAAYWWLYATFFSTLLPTALHAFVACAALWDWVLSRAAPLALAWLKRGKEEEFRRPIRAAINLFAAAQTAGLFTSLLLVWTLLWALTTGAHSAASTLFDIIIVFAKWVGALPLDFSRV